MEASGELKFLYLSNRRLIFERAAEGERVIVMINADSNDYTAHHNANAGRGIDLISGKTFDFGAGSYLTAYSVQYIKVE